MALRKLKKSLKPVIWVISIAFILSVFAAGAGSFFSMRKEEPALKVNGTKISVRQVEEAYARAVDYYSKNYKISLPENIMRITTLDSVIESVLLEEYAKSAHINVPSNETKSQYKTIVKQFNGEKQLKQYLNYRNTNLRELKEQIKKGILVGKAEEAIKKEAKVSDDEVKNYYEKNKYSMYLDKTFDEVKEDIKKYLESDKGNKYYAKKIEDLYKEAKIEKVDSRYEKYMKLEQDVEGYKVSNVDIAKLQIMPLLYKMAKTEEEASKQAMEGLKKDIAFAKQAIEKDLKADENLTEIDKIYDLKDKLAENIKATYKYTDKELSEYFEKNKEKYAVKESLDAKLIYFGFKPSEEDKANVKMEKIEKRKARHILIGKQGMNEKEDKEAKAKATKLLAEALKEDADFAKLAKENSEGPSAPNGGDLGWFEKNKMVKEFADASFAGEVGKVYPKLVKTMFGYHIIKIEDKRVDEKPLAVVAGEKTKKEIEDKANALFEKIKTKEITFEDAMKESELPQKEEFKKILKKGGYIQGSNDSSLKDKLFDLELNKESLLKTDKGICIALKTNYVPYKQVELSEVKERVLSDLLNKVVMDKMK